MPVQESIQETAPSIRVGVGSYSKFTDEQLRLLRQIGVEDVLVIPYAYDEDAFEPELPLGRAWTYGELTDVRERIEDAGLRLHTIETLPIPLYRILLTDDPNERAALVDEVCESVRNVGRAGIDILGYSGHPPAGAQRTTMKKPVRGGALASAFDASEAERQVGGPVDHSEETLWERYEEFIEAVLPVAEDAGVQLAVHPSDPPVESIDGIPLLFRSRKNFDRALDLVPSENHGVKLCLGCFSEMGEDAVDVVSHFEDDITYIHFRDVVGSVPRFYETFIDDEGSNYDEAAVIRTLQRIGFDGVVTSDHVPQTELDAEQEFGGDVGRVYTVGYLRGLVRASTE